MTGVNSTTKYSKETIAKQFQTVLDYNAKLRNDFNQALTFARALEKEDNVDTKHSSAFAQRSGIIGDLIKDKLDLADFYNKLKAMIVDLIKAMELVVEKLDLEREELKKYFDSIHFEEITTLRTFEKKAIDYNREERELIFNVFSKVPGLDGLANTILGTQEKYVMESHAIFAAAAANFTNHYLDFYRYFRTENKDNKEPLLNTFIQTITYLENYIREAPGIIQDFARGFIKEVKKSSLTKSQLESIGLELSDKNNVKKSMDLFLQNFFGASVGKGITIINGIKTFESDLGIEKGRISKTYSSANDDDKLDKAFTSWLKLLFEGIEIIVVEEKEIKKAKDVIEKIIPKKSDMGDLKDTFNENIIELEKIIQSDANYQFRKGMGAYDLIIILLDKTEINLGKIRDDKFYDNPKNDHLAEGLDSTLETIIEAASQKDKNKKEAYTKFLALNKKKRVLKEKGESKKEDDDSEKLSNKTRDSILDQLNDLFIEGLDEDESGNLHLDSSVDRGGFISKSALKLLINEMFGSINDDNESETFDKVLATFKSNDGTDEDSKELLKLVKRGINSSNIDLFWELFSKIFGNSLETK